MFTLKMTVMTADSASINLTHHFLIAMPGLEDSTFAKSVVYLCEHSERGALGLVINKPSDLSMPALFEKVELPLKRQDLIHAPVLKGGPVHTERGFVLHEPMFVPTRPTPATGDEAQDERDALAAVSAPEQASAESVYASTMTIPGGLEMTTSKDVLEALSTGAGPKRVLISLGYSAWGEGQLESELAENSWLTVGADPAIIFDTPIEERYERAMALLGLQSWMLSSEAGHA
jgi:putative transcriptional regulator